eukprot:3936988-Prymnesium_polylepis.1
MLVPGGSSSGFKGVSRLHAGSWHMDQRTEVDNSTSAALARLKLQRLHTLATSQHQHFPPQRQGQS